MSLKDKIAIATGSSRGIGFAIAKEFAENNGAAVIVCSRSHERATKAAAQINGKTFAAKVDVTNDTSIKEFIQQISSKFNQIDILANNADIHLIRISGTGNFMREQLKNWMGSSKLI